jgi:K+-transporting ATPase KdpF subunit
MGTLLFATTAGAGTNITGGYIAGGIIAFLLLIYLVYALAKPDKF